MVFHEKVDLLKVCLVEEGEEVVVVALEVVDVVEAEEGVVEVEDSGGVEEEEEVQIDSGNYYVTKYYCVINEKH